MSVQYGRKCLLCNNTRYRSKECRLFRFPARDSAMWSRWLMALGLSELDIDGHSNEPPRLCQLHFDPKDFLQRKLSGMAVPKRYEWTPEKEKNIGRIKDTSEISGVKYILERRNNKRQADTQQRGLRICRYAADNDTLSNGPEDLVETESNESDNRTLTDVSEQQSTAEHAPCDDFSSYCNITQHESLAKALDLERARVKELQYLNAQQKHIIEEQRILLLHLGVQYTPLEESEYDS